MKCDACPATTATLRQVWWRGRIKIVRLCNACRSNVDVKRQRTRNAQRAKRPLGVMTKTPDQK